MNGCKFSITTLLHILNPEMRIMRWSFFTCEHAERRQENKSNKNVRRSQKATMYGEANPHLAYYILLTTALLLYLLLRTSVNPERNRSRRTHLCSFSECFPLFINGNNHGNHHAVITSNPWIGCFTLSADCNNPAEIMHTPYSNQQKESPRIT